MEKKKVNVKIVEGVAGKALYIDNYRVNGAKPWGGGKIVNEWNFMCDINDIKNALGIK